MSERGDVLGLEGPSDGGSSKPNQSGWGDGSI